MSNFTLPSDDRLEQLIRESFEMLPGPDMRRLKQLEERLARAATGARPRQKLNTLPWWIVLLLAGGFAAAAWWAGNNKVFVDISQDQRMDNDMVQGATIGKPAESEPEIESRPDQQEAEVYDDGRDTPIIYSREPL